MKMLKRSHIKQEIVSYISHDNCFEATFSILGMDEELPLDKNEMTRTDQRQTWMGNKKVASLKKAVPVPSSNHMFSYDSTKTAWRTEIIKEGHK